jgi:hypothetical protein
MLCFFTFLAIGLVIFAVGLGLAVAKHDSGTALIWGLSVGVMGLLLLCFTFYMLHKMDQYTLPHLEEPERFPSTKMIAAGSGVQLSSANISEGETVSKFVGGQSYNVWVTQKVVNNVVQEELVYTRSSINSNSQFTRVCNVYPSSHKIKELIAGENRVVLVTENTQSSRFSGGVSRKNSLHFYTALYNNKGVPGAWEEIFQGNSWTDLVSLGVGREHIVAAVLDERGVPRIYTRGSNEFGQLGVATLTTGGTCEEVKLPELPIGSSFKIGAVVVGGDFSIVAISVFQNTVPNYSQKMTPPQVLRFYGWGHNDMGQFGPEVAKNKYFTPQFLRGLSTQITQFAGRIL